MRVAVEKITLEFDIPAANISVPVGSSTSALNLFLEELKKNAPKKLKQGQQAVNNVESISWHQKRYIRIHIDLTKRLWDLEEFKAILTSTEKILERCINETIESLQKGPGK